MLVARTRATAGAFSTAELATGRGRDVDRIGRRRRLGNGDRLFTAVNCSDARVMIPAPH